MRLPVPSVGTVDCIFNAANDGSEQQDVSRPDGDSGCAIPFVLHGRELGLAPVDAILARRIEGGRVATALVFARGAVRKLGGPSRVLMEVANEGVVPCAA